MMKVEFVGPVHPGHEHLASGVVFGTLGESLIFRLLVGESSLELRFLVAKDAEKKALEFGSGPQEGNVFHLAFYNPQEGLGSSGLKEPFKFASGVDRDLYIMFLVDLGFRSQTYRLSYQFFARQADRPAEVKAK